MFQTGATEVETPRHEWLASLRLQKHLGPRDIPSSIDSHEVSILRRGVHGFCVALRCSSSVSVWMYLVVNWRYWGLSTMYVLS